MIKLKIIGKALLIIVCCITFNILAGTFLFKETLDSKYWGGAISGGIGSGLVLIYLYSKKKKPTVLSSKV